MTCVPFSSSAPYTASSRAVTCQQLALAMLAALASTMLLARTARAQQSLSVPAMRAPVLQLVQPSSGGSVPTDRPVVFFRYGPGEPTDPIDDASFQVWVDGAERTARFRIGNGEAWGTLAAASNTSGLDSTSRASAAADARSQLTAGAHLVTARVCSVRGVCSTAHDILTAMPVAATPDESPSTGPRQRSTVDRIAAGSSDSARVERRKRHSHLKQPLTLVGDLVRVVGKLFR